MMVLCGGCQWALPLRGAGQGDGVSGQDSSTISEAGGDLLPVDLHPVDLRMPCSDGLHCTLDALTERGCVHALLPGYCLIDGQCFASEASNPNNLCEECNPAKSTEAWSSDNITCNDGVACTYADRCGGGTCSGTSYSCQDVSATFACLGNACNGLANAPLGCVLLPGYCLIEGQCYQQGQTFDLCQVCNPTVSGYSWSPSAGCVSTLAGSVSGYKDGFGVQATFMAPRGLVVDQGSLVVSETSGHWIRRITRGHVLAVAGCG